MHTQNYSESICQQVARCFLHLQLASSSHFASARRISEKSVLAQPSILCCSLDSSLKLCCIITAANCPQINDFAEFVPSRPLWCEHFGGKFQVCLDASVDIHSHPTEHQCDEPGTVKRLVLYSNSISGQMHVATLTLQCWFLQSSGNSRMALAGYCDQFSS